MKAPQRWLRNGRSWAWRRQRRGQVPHAAILMYHRVAVPPAADPWRLCVSPKRFDEQLRALRRFADIVPLERLPQAMRVRCDGRPVVAITFDDGYLDNLTAAKPILERHDAPATVFLATGCIEHGGRYWWDRLLDVVHGQRQLPDELHLDGSHGPFAWRNERATGSAAAQSAARQALRDALWHWLVRLSGDERDHCLSRLDKWAGHPASLDAKAQPMSPGQVAELVAGGLVRAGAHTANHVHLPLLDREQGLAEIVQSRRDCVRLAGAEPDCFAFPFGAYDERAVSCAREAGFRLACTSDRGLAWADDEPLALPRIAVGDWSGLRLEGYLHHYWLA
jgi:peptidoglycan/xylan/chitin deacetylase (PgdA/CDA1 family)